MRPTMHLATTVRALAVVAFTGATLLASCADANEAGLYVDAITGEDCTPDPGTLVPLHGHKGKGNGKGGHNSPTGIAGDNVDDTHSGQVDCLGDGDSGHGNDGKFCPPPGCDRNGCCEEPPTP